MALSSFECSCMYLLDCDVVNDRWTAAFVCICKVKLGC